MPQLCQSWLHSLPHLVAATSGSYTAKFRALIFDGHQLTALSLSLSLSEISNATVLASFTSQCVQLGAPTVSATSTALTATIAVTNLCGRGLSTGAIIGIAVGGAVAAAVVIIILLLVAKVRIGEERRRKEERMSARGGEG